MAGFVFKTGGGQLVERYQSIDLFPQAGKEDKIYFAIDTQKSYVWDGSEYTPIAISKTEIIGTENFYQKYITELKNYFDL